MSSMRSTARTLRSGCGTTTAMYLPSGESTTSSNAESRKKSLTGISLAEASDAHNITSNSIHFKNFTDSPSVVAIGSMHFHQCDETVEQQRYVMRARTRLRMPLERERRRIGQRQALVGSVEQRAVRHAHVRRQRRLVDGETVVLAGDEHAPRIQVDDGMVGTVVPELHLQRLG